MKKNDLEYFEYDTEKYNFVDLLKGLFKTDDLRKLHEKINSLEYLSIFTNNNDDQTIFHKKFYERLNSEWIEFSSTYSTFIREVVSEKLNEKEFIYQRSPTFRVQLPNNIAVGGQEGKEYEEKYGWHKDSDPEYNHPPGEKNFIIPLTYARDTASVFIETYPESNKFSSAKMNVGEFFRFNGSECIHGNKKNITNFTRVSLDFRVILLKDYNEEYAKQSKLSTKKFRIGEYYEKI